jgi:formate/nitrite transporter FocA (FNT family)
MVAQASDNAPFAPELTDRQEQQSRKVESVSLPVIHEVIRRRGEDELARSNSALAWSGLAAGLSMGFSMISEGLLRAHLPSASWTPLVAKFGYSVGFVVVILGRQQLFTENTLTPVIPVLARRDMATLLQMLRLWLVVLVSNVVGAFCVAWVLGHTDVFDANVRAAFEAIGRTTVAGSFLTTLIRGIFAGWLIALVVWLLPSVPSSRFTIIVVLTWLVGVGELSHVIAGSVESFYVVTTGSASWSAFFMHFFVPALIGNVTGGVSLVALINHAQLVAGRSVGNSQPPKNGSSDEHTDEPAETETDDPTRL